ncbi:MAG: FixH family protein [Candidatus Flexifilum sp.]|jgi:hypothetical protein
MNIKLFLSMLVLALGALALAGCRQAAGGVPVETQTSDLRIDLAYEPMPAVVGGAMLMVRVMRTDGTPVNDATITARGDMSHAGMQPVDGTGERFSDGLYRVPFTWTMAGDWFVTITATLPDGTSATRRFDLTVGS